MADKAFDSIIDSFLADREPDWKDLGLKDAQKSGEDVLDQTHKYEDDFLDDLTSATSKHTAVPPSKSATLTNRLYEKEKAAPHVTAVRDNWHTAASEDGKAENDTESLMNEVTMTLEQAGKEGTVEKKEISEASVQKYIKSLLNMGMSPSKVAAKLEKLAELELFNHQIATDYLQRNAGMMGLAYMEPNTFMDKQNPNYRHTAQGGGDSYGPICPKCDAAVMEPTYTCPNCGYKQGSKTSAEQYVDPVRHNAARQPQFGSNDCVFQHTAWKQAGIKPQARSVKQIKACGDCSYFKKDSSGKRCNLYHLPVVANTQELSQIVNNLTPGVPQKQKHAALVQIANRTDEHVQPFDAGKTAQTNIVKTADARVDNQAKRNREPQKSFTAAHVAKLHDKGVTLRNVYKWADKKFGSVDTSVAFRGFVQSLRKNEKGRIVVASADLQFLNSIGIRSEAFEGSAKCASCPNHFAREIRPVESDRGAMRVEGKFAERTPDTVRTQQKQAAQVTFTADTVEKLHSAGHSMEKIFKAAASKVGSVQAKKAVTAFINSIKGKPIKVALSQLDCTFLKNKLGVQNAIIGAEKCGSCSYRNGMHCGLTGGTLLSFPGMEKASMKTASSAVVRDGHSILNEYDLSAPVQGPDINTDGPDLMDVETKSTFSLGE